MRNNFSYALLNFQKSLFRKIFHQRSAQYSPELPPHSQFQPTDITPQREDEEKNESLILA